jgi:hypothetical protein
MLGGHVKNAEDRPAVLAHLPRCQAGGAGGVVLVLRGRSGAEPGLPAEAEHVLGESVAAVAGGVHVAQEPAEAA